MTLETLKNKVEITPEGNNMSAFLENLFKPKFEDPAFVKKLILKIHEKFDASNPFMASLLSRQVENRLAFINDSRGDIQESMHGKLMRLKKDIQGRTGEVIEV